MQDNPKGEPALLTTGDEDRRDQQMVRPGPRPDRAAEDQARRREVRLPDSLAAKLHAHLAAQPDQDSTAILFPNESGAPLDPTNLRPRVLKPLVRQAGAPWAGFHTFRHTFASLHLSRGTNLLQLSRALGHHSPAFTLTRYTHLLAGDEAPALDLASTRD